MSADELVVILDRSGSMASIVSTAISEFNDFLAEQGQVEREANFTLVQFNHHYETVYDGINIKMAPPLDRRTYVPDGYTALYDAIGRGVLQVASRASRTDAKVYFAILTDGHENASREFTLDQIKTMIEQKTAEGWKFFYLVAGVEQYEAERLAQAIFINKKYVRAEKFGDEGRKRLNRSMSLKMKMMREDKDDDMDLKDMDVQ